LNTSGIPHYYYVITQGSRLKAQGSRLKAQGSRLKAQGSRLKAQGSRLKAIAIRVVYPKFMINKNLNFYSITHYFFLFPANSKLSLL